MNTVMHAQAMPAADTAALSSPEAAARVLIDRIRTIEELPSGARIDLSAAIAAIAAGRAEETPAGASPAGGVS